MVGTIYNKLGGRKPDRERMMSGLIHCDGVVRANVTDAAKETTDFLKANYGDMMDTLTGNITTLSETLSGICLQKLLENYFIPRMVADSSAIRELG